MTNSRIEDARPALMRPSIRMQEIADAVGVSVATVSRALTGSNLVKAETRTQIEEVAAQLGYTLNHIARSLRTQRTWLVVAIVPDIGNPFYSYVLAGIEDEAQRLGYSVLIGNVAGDKGRAKRYGDRLLAGTVDGVILLNGQLPEPDWMSKVNEHHLPVVALCERIAGVPVPVVAIDDYAAGALMTRYLISRGHRTIAHICGPSGNVLAQDRMAGYRAALRSESIPLDPALVAIGDFTINSGYAAVEQLYRTSPDISAIFCASDEMAIGAINALRDRGLSVPNDVSVAGCDGLEFGAKYYPPIATIEQPRVELGATAMALLHQLTVGETVAEKTILPVRLMERMSVSAPQFK